MDAIEPPRAPNLPPEIVPLRARQFRLPKTFSALRHRNFRLFLSGQIVSLAGTWMQIIAQGWLVYAISGSELVLGIVGFASAVPVLIIAPWGGVLVDNVPKRNVLVATQSAAMLLALILAYLTFAGVVQVWHVIVLASCLGVVNAVDGPARQAFVVEMVGRDDLPNAIALNSMTFNSARIVGPAIGGVVLVAAGSAWCFLFNGLSYLAVIAGILAMRLPDHQRKRSTSSPWTQLKGGLVYVRRNREVGALLSLALTFGLFGISYGTVLPAFVDKVLSQGAGAFGAINTASGIGAVFGAFLVARYGDRGSRGKWLGRSVQTFPIFLAVFALNHSYALALVLALSLGTGFMLVFTLTNTLLQTHISDEMRGRVLSLYTLTFFGFAPFGNLIIGTASETIGLSRAIVASAGLCMAGASLILWKVPDLRRLP